jgi:CheY-like chemotaxis protein
MRILVAEDEPNIAKLHKMSFEGAGHDVFITHDGVECIEAYKQELQAHTKRRGWQEDRSASPVENPPFDVIILDYRMPRKDGMQVAREVLDLVSNQRIIFVSAYVVNTLQEAVMTLNRVVELVQKPFDIDELISLVEDKAIWSELEKMNVNVSQLQELHVNHDTILQLLEGLKKLQKGKGLAIRY